ncbi:hypothetical protein A3A03_03475 [Candidatus Nomurabacteria bacterium RIFCSPLOWO2_01_FULL_40_18]|uniref:Uncharacterized protein n=1 Tax=Candidatus Nomurabacteria bacterium RIFCSPLOWO2_01_FULL_40_18 TaxID=1801773 RepID=A0A1F6XKE6_9BACT|nr:MAG: hypothetical protein A3A03_03475 [Candidatus Nomurabacteria bacterium RIFCSPLOWO2_01_FULL_40_18]
MKNPQLVIGIVIIVFAFIGGIPFSGMKSTQTRRAGFITMLLAVILGLGFVVRGIYLYDLSLRDERRAEQEAVRRVRAEKEAVRRMEQSHTFSVSTNK